MQSDECIPDTVWLTTSALSAMPTCTQNVEEEPLTWWSSSSYVGRQPDQNVEEVYSESHRLAVEELVAGGIDAYYAFLTKERVRNFLSDDEIEFILHTAVPHESPPQPGDSSSYVLHDTTSLAYFPNVSDIEAPTLDIGWPELNPYKLRGPTTSVAHFHPNYAAYTPVERIYTCKEAARRMIKSAKEVGSGFRQRKSNFNSPWLNCIITDMIISLLCVTFDCYDGGCMCWVLAASHSVDEQSARKRVMPHVSHKAKGYRLLEDDSLQWCVCVCVATCPSFPFFNVLMTSREIGYRFPENWTMGAIAHKQNGLLWKSPVFLLVVATPVCVHSFTAVAAGMPSTSLVTTVLQLKLQLQPLYYRLLRRCTC